MSLPRPPDALDVIAKMFVEPMPQPGPSRMATENLQTEQSAMEYIPTTWADPLVPYHLECGGVGHSFDDMPAVTTCVTNGLFRTEPPRLCELSAQGQQLRGFIKQYNSDFLKIHEEMDPDLLADLLTKATILDGANDVVALDEAAFLRLLMLQTMTVDPVQLVETSSAVNEMAFNMYVKPTDIQSCWSPALEASNGLQIGTESETSTLYFRTLDEYTHDQELLKTKDGQEVDHRSVVFVPVKLSWQNRTWLMPYILAFTTTAWWNHAYTIDVTYSNSMESKIEDKLMKQRFMPRSSMVYIVGGYKRICLVVVDARRETFPPDTYFKVCEGISATRLGNFEFAKHVHSYLKRTVDPSNPTSHITQPDCVHALNRMKELYCTPNQFRLFHLEAAILATSRFNGFGVSPTPEAVPGGHLFGPVQFNSQTPMKIGDYILPDLLDETAKIRSQRLYCHQMWRCDPLGYFTYGSVSLLKDHDQNPCLHKLKVDSLQYTVSNSPRNQRILRACGLIETEPVGNDCRPFEGHLLTTLAYGSLMLGLTNWAFVELGCTMFEHNGLGTIRFHSLWSSLTQGFVIEPFPYNNDTINNQRFLKSCGWIMNWASNAKDVDNRWFDCHYSWNVPWWYVASIAHKLGYTFDHDVIKDTNDWLIISHLDDSPGQNKHPYDLSILTASSQYERDVHRGMPAYFGILTPTSKRQTLKYNSLSWNPNRALDKKKTNFRFTFPPRQAAAVELNVVVLPSARIPDRRPRAYVSECNRVDPNNYHTYPRIACLRWPHIDLNWYRDGQKVVIRPSITVIPHHIDITEDDEDSEEEKDIIELSIGLENQNLKEEVTELAS